MHVRPIVEKVALTAALLAFMPAAAAVGLGRDVLHDAELVWVKRLRLRVLDRQLSIQSNDGSVPELASVADVGERIHIHGRVIAAWNLKRL